MELQQTVSLVFTPIEDANLGFWVAGMNISRINWEGIVLSGGWTCCFARSTHKCVLHSTVLLCSMMRVFAAVARLASGRFFNGVHL